jgi:hypothetical protein
MVRPARGHPLGGESPRERLNFKTLFLSAAFFREVTLFFGAPHHRNISFIKSLTEESS